MPLTEDEAPQAFASRRFDRRTRTLVVGLCDVSRTDAPRAHETDDALLR
jgi:hypothetical protein